MSDPYYFDWMNSCKKADGSFRHVTFKEFGRELGNSHGDHLIPPWERHPRHIGYVTDDFGACLVVLEEGARSQRRSEWYE